MKPTPLNYDYHADNLIREAKKFQRMKKNHQKRGQPLNWNVLMDIQSVINQMKDLMKKMDDSMDNYHILNNWIVELKSYIEEDG